jgi:hypothetical protein
MSSSRTSSRTTCAKLFWRAAPLALILAAGVASPAFAVPSFGQQTGMPCQACHVGGFGPQLTPFGRSFKLHGYTQRGPDAFAVPFSAMAVASYLHTQADQPPQPGFKANDNVALDQLSLFFASGLGSHLGAFIQGTYDGIAKAWTWDNLDVRATTTAHIKDAEVLLGASLNNSPTVQDAWNTLPAWGYPYTSSALAPSPVAAPLLAGALAQTTLGVTGYAWINSTFYLEGGAYGSPSTHTIANLGADPFSPGNINGLAPYGRLAYQRTLGAGTLELGAFGFQANLFPGRDQTTGATDRYRDLGLDGSYQVMLGDGDVITVDTRYMDEQQTLNASYLLGLAQNRRNDLKDFRADLSYYWRNRIGGTVGLFRTTGSADNLLYAGDRTFMPDSTGVMLQADATPFGDGKGPLGGRMNLRVGVQYTFYPEFDGARHNYDGAGAYAGDNNTLRVFTWLAF